MEASKFERAAWLMIAIVLVSLLWAAISRERVLQAELNDLRSKVAQQAIGPASQQRKETLTETAAVPLDDQVSAVAPIADPRTISSESSNTQGAKIQDASVSSSDWKAAFYSSEIERLVAVSPEQREQLRAEFASRFLDPSAKPIESYREVLKDVLGEEVAARYEEARAREELEREAREIEEESIVLARRLSLSKEQEQLVREKLRAVRIELRPLNAQIGTAMREAMSLHSGENTDRARLRESYDQLKTLNEELRSARSAALQAKLRESLSDEQFNELVRQLEERERY